MSDYNNGQIWEMIWKLLHWIGMQEQEACMRENDYIKLEKERDALEAKLAKAVEALERALKYNTAMHGGAGAYNKQIKDAIAELKGESHD